MSTHSRAQEEEDKNNLIEKHSLFSLLVFSFALALSLADDDGSAQVLRSGSTSLRGVKIQLYELVIIQ